MIRSMTGFGLGEATSDGLVVRTEIRSVNHRFLQTRFRLPPEFAELEPRVDAVLKKVLSRGSVSLTVNTSRESTPTAVKVDHDLAGRYVKLLRKTAKQLELEDDLQLSHVAALPGVVGSSGDARGHQREAKVVMTSVGLAIESLVAMRCVEGRSLEKDIKKHARVIAQLYTRVSKRMPRAVAAHHKAMRMRAAKLLGDGGQIKPSDLARELAILTEKTDVSEELSRLESHMDQLHKVLRAGGEVGRKLDFLVQELYREANTICSKAADAQVAHIVVDLKTHIERVREQVQNIE